jgi:HK97 family phage major capsid protein
MSLNAKIKAAQAAIALQKDELTALVTKASEGEQVEAEVIETLTKSIEENQKQVDSMIRAEGVLMSKSAPAFVRNAKASEYSFEKSALVTMKSKLENKSQLEAAAELYGEDSGTFAVTKAAVAPARTDAAGWAQELLRPAYAEFMDALRPASILPQLAGKGGRTLSFDTNGTVIVPFFNGAGTLGGAFIGEGASIPVKASAVGTKTVKQAKLGVISAFTAEILRRSTPDIEPIVRQAIVEDTAAVLDSQAFGSAAASAVAPAGLLNGVVSVDATGVAGSILTAEKVVKALKAALDNLSNVNLGKKPVIIMRPATARGISLLMSQTGSFIFAAEIASGRLLGMDIIISQAAPANEAIIADVAELAFGLGSPSFTVSDSAAVAMDSAGAGTMTSLFQNDMVALRMIANTAWADLRSGAVQHIANLYV